MGASMREIFQTISDYPIISIGCAIFVWFVLSDIADAFRKAGNNSVTHNYYGVKDAKHGVNRRGEGED